MSFGMRIWGANGTLQLDENSFTVQVIYSAVVQRPAGGPISTFISLPGITPDKYSAVCLPIGAYPQDPNAQNAFACQYEPQVVNNGVTVWFLNRNAQQGSPGLPAMRLIVMKFR